MTRFIIEHLDPRLWKWSFIEYSHISGFVGKKNLIFTNIKKSKDVEKLKKLGKPYSKSVRELKFSKMCILDPAAKQTLRPADKKFDCIVLGGVLGDFPMKRRTKKELSDPLKTRDVPSRNLGKNQMSTNTAAYVAWKIINGTPIEKIKFQRKLVVKISDCEEIELPFKFVVEDSKVVLPKGYIELIKGKG